MSDEGAKSSETVNELFRRVRQCLPADADTGFFERFMANNEESLAWRELAAAAKQPLPNAEIWPGREPVPSVDFWRSMAEAARLLGMPKEARDAMNDAEGGGVVEIRLPRAEATVLFEWLWREGERSKNNEQRGYAIEHPAERYTLWYLLNALEELLPEPFAPNYSDLLDDARKEVSDKCEGE